MSHTQNSAPPYAFPGLWREDGGLTGRMRLDVPATTPGIPALRARVFALYAE